MIPLSIHAKIIWIYVIVHWCSWLGKVLFDCAASNASVRLKSHSTYNLHNLNVEAYILAWISLSIRSECRNLCINICLRWANCMCRRKSTARNNLWTLYDIEEWTTTAIYALLLSRLVFIYLHKMWVFIYLMWMEDFVARIFVCEDNK